MNKKYIFIVGLCVLISGCSTEHPAFCLNSLDGEICSCVYQYDRNQLEKSYFFKKILYK